MARPDEFPPRAFPRPGSQILRNSSGDGERLPARGETISRGVRKRERAGGGRTIAFAGSESTNSGREPRALASRTSGWGREPAGFRPWFAPRCGTCEFVGSGGLDLTASRKARRVVPLGTCCSRAPSRRASRARPSSRASPSPRHPAPRSRVSDSPPGASRTAARVSGFRPREGSARRRIAAGCAA